MTVRGMHQESFSHSQIWPISNGDTERDKENGLLQFFIFEEIEIRVFV
jgi:hypothetical protein